MKRFKMGDLLIDPDFRFVVQDKGSTWVTDRFVMVRGDLFKKIPTQRVGGTLGGRSLPVSRLRLVLADARGAGRGLESTGVRHVNTLGYPARAWRAGGALIFLNERVTRCYFLAGLRPRYIASQETVAWYGKKRGRDVLMVVQKPVIPFALEYSELEQAAS